MGKATSKRKTGQPRAKAGKKNAVASKTLISIVVPVFNEVENVGHIVPAVDESLQEISSRYDLEFLFTDNHSTDGTFEELQKIADSDPRVRAIRFSRNFGYQKSIRAGYFNARGQCVIQLDADLQDPPAIAKKFIEAWEQGAKVVFGIRISRQEGMAINGLRKLFYRAIRKMSDEDLPVDAGDFRLVDRRIIDELKLAKSASPYLRGEIATLGFNQVGIPYDRAERKRGTSKFSAMQLIDLALDGFAAHTTVPLRLATYFGLFVFLATVASSAVYIFGRIISQQWPPGFATLTVLLLLSMSFNALFLGIIGEYLARIYREVSGNNDVIVETRIGIDDKER